MRVGAASAKTRSSCRADGLSKVGKAVTKVFLISAAGVAAAQLLPLTSTQEERFQPHYLVPLAAVCLFLCGMAFAARGAPTPMAVRILAVFVGAAFLLFSAPAVVLPPAVEFAFHLAGVLSLSAIVAWMSVHRWALSHWRAALVGTGGALGILAFLHGAIARYGQYYESRSMGVDGIAAWAAEFTLLFGLGGILGFLAGKSAPVGCDQA